MGKVSYGMSVSLDGFIEGTNGDLGWTLVDQELHQHFNDLESATDILLYGRRLYETMAAFWPTADENPSAPPYEIEYARIWKSKPKIVFSRTLDQVGWNSRLIRDNVAAEIRRLKDQPGITMSVGGAGLAATLMQIGLIDEYRLYIAPTILGGGKPMFGALRDRINLQLVETHTFGSGVVLLRYEAVE
jgi:dihydrofolate reductase